DRAEPALDLGELRAQVRDARAGAAALHGEHLALELAVLGDRHAAAGRGGGQRAAQQHGERARPARSGRLPVVHRLLLLQRGYGPQCGWVLSPPPRVICRTFSPSTSTTKISGRPVRREWNASLRPSGAQVGFSSLRGWVTSGISPPPSGSISQMSNWPATRFS